MCGTMYGSGEVQEITGLSDAEYEWSDNNFLMDELQDGAAKVKSRTLVTFSKDLQFMVCRSNISTNSTPEYVIESFPVSESGIYQIVGISSSGTEYKKYRYTLAELGISSNENIKDIALGCAGLNGNSKECLLIILTDLHTHFYTYHLSDNGVIGRVYETETNVIENYMTDPLDGTSYIYTSNQTPNIFYTIDYSRNITDNNYYIIKHTLTMLPNSQPYLVSDNGNLFKRDSISFNRQNCGTYITQDDRFLVVNVSPGSSSSYIGALIKINGETHAADSFYSLNSQYNANVILNNYNILIRISATKMEMYNISYNENNEISTLNLIKEININLSGGNNRVYDFNVLTLDNSRIVIITALKQGSSSEKNFNLTIFDVDTILNTINGETITPIQVIPFIQTNEPIGMYSDISGANIKVPTSENRLKGFYTAVDAGNLIGVIYQGKTFLKVTPEVLSAVSGDVKNGKTFIGSSGAVEIGTLEVNG